MADYIIFTDTGCDIEPSVLAEWGVPYRSLTFRFTDGEKEYVEGEIESKAFYDMMRNGKVAKTAAVNAQTFAEAFEEILKQGKDILHIGFSSGLSTTFNSARLAAESLREQYPERKIIVVDSLAASAGQGLLVYYAAEKKKSGAGIDENAAYIEELKWRICHWFTVDDLVYLKRGGRISPTAAFVGNMLGIKPVLHVDNEGHLINMFKVRGRKTSIASIADKYGELAVNPENGVVFICHADCMSDVEELSGLLKSRYNATVKLVTNTGTVIGAHSGPGTIALFFEGKER